MTIPSTDGAEFHLGPRLEGFCSDANQPSSGAASPGAPSDDVCHLKKSQRSPQYGKHWAKEKLLQSFAEPFTCGCLVTPGERARVCSFLQFA